MIPLNEVISYFLLGADKNTIPTAAAYAQNMFLGWNQVGFHDGYLTNESLTSAVIDQINKVRPDLLLVGMGNPLQENWITRIVHNWDVQCA